MIILRDIVKYSPNGVQLVAECKLTQEEFNSMRTITLLNPDRVFKLSTVVYWWNGGYPPRPVYLDCPAEWRGKVCDVVNAMSMVNIPGVLNWYIKYKPPFDTGGQGLCA